jgi:hypothetical protein
MAITSLYKDYFQKSRIFLYPVLEIKRGVSVTPIQTHALWEGKYTVADMKLTNVYTLRNDPEFKAFEKSKLFGNKLFCNFFELSDGKGAYVFDFSKNEKDWNHFVEGKYSKLSQAHKLKIQQFYGKHHYAYIQSYLYPEKYFSIYADILTVSSKDHAQMYKLLKQVGELCEKPDWEKETLTAEIKSLDVFRKIT